MAENRASRGVPATDPLPSWHDTPTKRAILDFVARVTAEGGPDYVPPAERIATLDNDGTLWCEQPLIQALFILARVEALVDEQPELAHQQPYKAVLARDPSLMHDITALVDLAARTHTGMSRDAFKVLVRDFFARAAHPTYGHPLGRVVYRPMRELLDYLRASGFQSYICTGGTIEFVRVIATELYGIPPERVIGSNWVTRYRDHGDRVDLIIQPEPRTFNDKDAKPENIELHIGRRPILAVGNVGGAGDIAMLRYCQSRPGPTLQLLIDHDDAAREFAYAEPDNASLAAAARFGWTVVSMASDWRTIFDEAM